MSMLTPPGMGGKYRITGHRFPHMRRPRNRRRIVLAAVATAAVLGLAGWGTLQLVDVFSGGGGRGTQASSKVRSGDCKTGAKAAGQAVPRELPKPTDITVNVYNATPRTNLAKEAADELRRRGFRIGKVGNAPALYDKKVPGAGLLLGSPDAAEGALKVLATQLAGTETKNDQREGQDVDLMIGDAYKELASREDADRALEELGEPPLPTAQPSDLPSDSPSPSSPPPSPAAPARAPSPAVTRC
ncbi:LytR C-terminal domain-containing protein [Streptomyces sp. NPDC049577]|uniref:LytR C-terminal domain-containing protein n=1 Tax=Streptomyces sp. NPDC049577 TaxID=3155153 RepID=UPI0034490039